MQHPQSFLADIEDLATLPPCAAQQQQELQHASNGSTTATPDSVAEDVVEEVSLGNEQLLRVRRTRPLPMWVTCDTGPLGRS